ncbi:MAG: nuclease-related domain-containing protein [Acidimicrobiia bacterium]
MEVGTKAHWDPAASTVRCIVCPAPVADPFDLVPIDRIRRGVAGRSAGAEAVKRGERRGQTWRKGEEGEIVLGGLLDRKREADRDIETLHDRIIPGSKRNIDHIVVAASGVFVINAKKWSGTIEIKAPFLEKKRLIVGGRNRKEDLEKAGEEGKIVKASLEYEVPVRSVLCFVEGDWASLFRTEWVNGVLVASPRGLIKRLGKKGPMAAGGRELIADQLARAFPEF